MIDAEAKEIIIERKDLKKKSSAEIRLSPFKVLKILFASIFGLSIISLSTSFIKYVVPGFSSNWTNILMSFFYIDRENNVPTYFSSAILLLAAVLLGLIYYLKSSAKDNYSRYWAILALGFLFMSVDEYAGFHDLFNLSLQKRTDLSGWLYYPWIIGGVAVVTIVGFLFIPFLRNLEAQARKQFLLAGFIYVSGVIGMEMISGYVTDNFGGRETFLYALISHIEEILEMAGVSYFIYALLTYLRFQHKEFTCFKINIS